LGGKKAAEKTAARDKILKNSGARLAKIAMHRQP